METPQEFDLKKYAQLMYQKRYVFVAIMVIATSIGIALSYVLPKTYEAKSTVLIERNFMNELIKGITVTPSIDDRLKALEVILKSRSLILKVMGDLDLDLARKSDAEVEKIVKTSQKATEIKIAMNRSARSNMDMFTVSFRNASPAIARDYVNILIRRYIEGSLSHSRDETYGANKFLLEQIDLFKNKISAIEADIARLSRQSGTVAQERLHVLQKRLDDLRVQYTDNHPEVIKLKAEIETFRNQAKGRKSAADAGGMAEQQPEANAGRRKNLVGAENGTIEPVDKTRTQGAEPSASKLSDRQKLSSLERDRDTYKKIYEDLVATLGRSEVSTHIEVQDKGGTFTILEPAILPFTPVSPDRVKFILFGLLAGIGGGIGFIIMQDSMDKSVKTLDTLKTFGLPVLAVIPHIQNPADIRRTKRNDLLLYIATGVYLVCVTGLLSYELITRGVQ